MKQIILVVIIYLCISTSFAAKSPKPVDELEARVEALEAQIAELQAKPGPTHVLANGESIGIFLESSGSNTTTLFENNFWWVVSDKDYLFRVRAHTSQIWAEGQMQTHGILFDEPGCLGNSYVSLGPSTEEENLYRHGYVFASADPNDPIQTYYSPVDSIPVFGVIMSSTRILAGGCLDFGSGGSGDFSILVLPNDPAITGVANGVFAPPIRLGQ